MLLVPSECKNNARVWHYLQALTEAASTPIKKVLVMDLRESMRNGGGPACLRLRVELTATEAKAVNPGVLLTPALYVTLSDWVKQHYRDRMAEADLRDPALLDESRTALDRLTQILQLGSVYPFQSA
jgi:succinylarginine dihydrolase